MARWCSICDKRGHITSECWYKPNYIKEISREDGKLKKKYTLPSLQESGKTTLKSKHDKDEEADVGNHHADNENSNTHLNL